MGHCCKLQAFSVCLTIAVLSVTASTGWAADHSFSSEQIEFFEKEIRPLLVERCHKCHGADKQKGNLRLDSRAALLKGGDTGPAIMPQQPDESELVRAIRYGDDGYQMPPDGKLPQEDVDRLTQWVEMGAPWPSIETSAINNGVPQTFDFEERAKHWSFQPLQRPDVPAVQHTDWCRTPIDRFLLARLEEQGVTPAPETDRGTWLRRVSLDGIGLPPTPDELTAFLADDSPHAFETVIDRLLASPHFGERWGRHWLDLVRYAESRGHEFDYDVANPWHYRDYVIRAMNDDVPYDQFVVEHVAGDLLTASAERLSPVTDMTDGEPDRGLTSPARHTLRLHPQTGANESILATGFWFLGEWVHSPVDIRQDEADRFENMIDVYSKTFLGLTVACARCHDHKFDPITQKDFYALQGYLQSSSYRQARFETMEHNRRVAEQLAELDRQAKEPLLRTLAEMTKPVVDDLNKYLLAAKAVIENLPEPESPADEEGIETSANGAGIDAVILAQWVSHLRAAKADKSDPFHLWARYTPGELTMMDEVVDAARRIVEADPFAAWKQASHEKSTIESQELLPDSITVSRLDENDIVLSNDPHAPIEWIACRKSLRTASPIWGLQSDDGVLHESGATAGWQRSQGTIKTPTFEITGNQAVLCVAGAARTYVSVDSHILIHGPLHSTLVKDHPGPNHWHLIAHDVSRYLGHRAHIEIVPLADEPVAVMNVLQTNEPLPQQVSATGLEIATNIRWTPSGPGEELSEDTFVHYYDQFKSIGDCIDGFLDPEHNGLCWLDEAQWALEHPQLFGLDSESSREQFAKVSQPFIDRKTRLFNDFRPVSAVAPAMFDGSGEDEYVFIRGHWKKRGDVVPRRFLEVFHGEKVTRPEHGSGRLELAEWMVDPQQTPILPQVIVNRIWQHYFGTGLVLTPDDFGHMGRAPSHPELLDWLASELVSSGWSLKHVHRLILSSAAYRMSSMAAPSLACGPSSVEEVANSTALQRTSDDGPRTNNHNPQLLSRMPVKRLEGEIIRDAILSLSGRLDDHMYGRSVPVHLTPFMEGRGRPAESGPVDGAGRRSLYIAVRRNFANPFFQAFDMPNPHSTIGRRTVSNVPAQALAMMNNPMVIDQSQRWADRLLGAQPSKNTDSRIRHAYLACVSREPTESELAAAVDFLNEQSQELGASPDDPRVWADLCHVLMNAKEFLFVR